MSGKVLLAAPRGYCAGVERAVEAVELALEGRGRPVYVRKQIVHNLHVVRDLEAKGAIFVDDVEEVPAGAVAVLSAHGSPPRVFEEAAARGPRARSTPPARSSRRSTSRRAGSPPTGGRSC